MSDTGTTYTTQEPQGPLPTGGYYQWVAGKGYQYVAPGKGKIYKEIPQGPILPGAGWQALPGAGFRYQSPEERAIRTLQRPIMENGVLKKTYTDANGFTHTWNPRSGMYEVTSNALSTVAPVVGVASAMPTFDSSSYGSALNAVNTNLRSQLGQIEAGSRNRQIGFQDLLRQIGARAAGGATQFRSAASETGDYRMPAVMRGLDLIRGQEAQQRSSAYNTEAAAAAQDIARIQQARAAAAKERADIAMRQAAARNAFLTDWLKSQANFGGK